MKNILTVFFIFAFILFGCSFDKREGSTNREYLNELKGRPAFLVDHFPQKIESDPIRRSYGDNIVNQCIYYMLFLFQISETDKLTKREFLAIYQAADSNLITIKSRFMMDLGIRKEVSYKNIKVNNINYYPVPFFLKLTILNTMLSQQMMFIQMRQKAVYHPISKYM